MLILLILALLLLLRRCSCAPEPGPPAVAVPAPVGPSVPAPQPVHPLVPTPRLPKKPRPAYDPGPPQPVPWLGSFRLQVAARSPRLAACFEGADRPGRLKWTASVDPVHGAVSEHTLEPMLQTDGLPAAERACVLEALSDPPYRLEAPDGRSTPHRVGLVLEF